MNDLIDNFNKKSSTKDKSNIYFRLSLYLVLTIGGVIILDMIIGLPLFIGGTTLLISFVLLPIFLIIGMFEKFSKKNNE